MTHISTSFIRYVVLQLTLFVCAVIDPYGDDLEDLSVINYVEGTMEICNTILNAKQE